MRQLLQFELVYFIGAIIEELYFRWFLLKKWLLNTEKVPSIPAVLIISVLFAGMHLYNLRTGIEIDEVVVQIVFAFCFSIWGSAVVYKTNSIFAPLLAHILLNLTSSETNLWVSLLLGITIALAGMIIIKNSEKNRNVQ